MPKGNICNAVAHKGDYHMQDGQELCACGCVGESLELEEMTKLCINFAPAKTSL